MPLVRVAVIALAFMLAASCSGRSDERPRAERVAADFYTAVAQQDGAAACALLAPQTLHEVEQSAKQPCAEAITDEDLPDDLGLVSAATVYGNEAVVAAVGDTVFVSDFDGAWRIVAVGCTSQGDLPYDCEIKGG
ncbi:MAG: hypothetical protein QOD92_538 [Acidimicrobiaceae bacterium]